jgi:hypothetical protein
MPASFLPSTTLQAEQAVTDRSEWIAHLPVDKIACAPYATRKISLRRDPDNAGLRQRLPIIQPWGEAEKKGRERHLLSGLFSWEGRLFS